MTLGRSAARLQVHRMKSALDATYLRYRNSVLEVPIDVQQDLHLYMCVRLSGYLEQLLHLAITTYVSNSANDATREFALSWFRNAPNLSPAALEKLIKRFGSKWDEELKEFLDSNNNRQSLGTLIRIRNDTAHGASYQGSLSSISTYKKLTDDTHKWVVSRMIE